MPEDSEEKEQSRSSRTFWVSTRPQPWPRQSLGKLTELLTAMKQPAHAHTLSLSCSADWSSSASSRREHRRSPFSLRSLPPQGRC